MSPEQDHPFPWDPGAQPERTRLAWQRTGLSGLGCSLVVAKLVGTHSSVVGTVLAAVAVATTAAIFWVSRRRYRRSTAALFAAGRLPDAKLHVGATALIVLTGIGAAVYLLSADVLRLTALQP